MMNPAFFMFGIITAQYDFWKRSGEISFVISFKTFVASVSRSASDSAKTVDEQIKNMPTRRLCDIGNAPLGIESPTKDAEGSFRVVVFFCSLEAASFMAW
jgi:hypothetical protein